MNTRMRRICVGAAALALGTLVSGVLTLATPATSAGPAKATVSYTHGAQPNICRLGCV